MLVEEQPVQVVISDYRMPVMNGVDFLKEVYLRWPETIRIVLSGYADAGVIVAAINEGHIYKFIPKPWNEDELRFTVSNSLERYHLQRHNRELVAALAHYNEMLEKMVQERTADLELRNGALAIAQSMLHSLPFPVIGIDTAGMMVQGNQKAVELFREVESALLGTDCRDVLPQDVCRLLPDLAGDDVACLSWIRHGTHYDVHITPFGRYGQRGTVIMLIEKDRHTVE